MKPYRGRFAPSPTGPLHFGSLAAATASYLDAKAHQGEWLIRMEDLDTARVRPGSADSILADLEAFGFEHDGPIVWQSRRLDLYRSALDRLRDAGLVYPCACSRKEIADSVTQHGIPQPADAAARYPGTCRGGLPEGRSPRAWRVLVEHAAGEPAELAFADRLQGHYTQDVAEAVGDFVLLRADGPFAYQLAVVVDDAEQGITDVVRGADLLESTPRQLYLQRLLSLPAPRYLHIPVVTQVGGQKLSKQAGALALNRSDDRSNVSRQLAAALAFLGHPPPAELLGALPAEVWKWAIANWSAQRIPAVLEATA